MQWSDENNTPSWSRRLQSFESSPSDSVWNNIESRLDKKPSNTRIIAFGKYSAAAAVVLLLVGTFIFWRNDAVNDTKKLTASTSTEKANILPQEIISPKFPAVKSEVLTPVASVNESVKKMNENIAPLPTQTVILSSNLLKEQGDFSTDSQLPQTVKATHSEGDKSAQAMDYYQAGLMALGKGQLCTSHYNITMAKRALCTKDHLNHEVDQMIRFVEDKLASNCLCMADDMPQICE